MIPRTEIVAIDFNSSIDDIKVKVHTNQAF
jgi:CBS domain containing-hemolysin-like protein